MNNYDDSNYLIELGKLMLEKLNYDEALDLFEKAINLNLTGNNARPWLGKGIAFYELGLYDLALESINKSIESDDKNALCWKMSGIIYNKLGKHQEAVNSFTQAIELEENDVQSWFGKGEAFFSLGQYNEALKSYNKITEIDATDGKGWYEKGRSYIELGQFEYALQSFNTAIELIKDNALLWYGRGKAQFNLYHFEEALDSLNIATDLDKNNAILWYEKGNTFTKLCKYDKALEAYNIAIELDDRKEEYWYAKGTICYRLGNYEDAIKSCDKAIELNGNDAEAFNIKGMASVELGYTEEALESFNKAIELDENCISALGGRGNVLNELGNANEALESFNKAIELDNEEQFLWLGKGNAHFKLKEYEKALTSYKRAIELDKMDQFAWFGIARVYLKLGQYEEALKSSDETIKLDDIFATPWYMKGLAYLGLHQLNEAQRSFYRSYYLVSRFPSYLPRHIRKLLPFLVGNINDNFDAKLILINLIESQPNLLTYFNFSKIYDEAINRTKEIILLLEYILSEVCPFEIIEKKKYSGLLYFYSNEPIRAADYFDELKFENDLMIHYYLIESLKSFNEDYSSVLNNAVRIIESNLNSKIEMPELQLYYAGQILLSNNDYVKALDCFVRIRNYLPANYMELLCLKMLDNVESIEKFIVSIILPKEKKLFQQRKNGYLFKVSPFTVELSDPDLDRPFKMFSHFMEISPAVILVNEWLDNYQKQYNNLPEEFSFINTSFHENERNIEGWIYFDKIKIQLEKERERITKTKLLQAEFKLKSKFFEIPLKELAGNESELEMKFLDLIKNYDFEIYPEKYIWLVQYYFYTNRISAHTAILLTYYLVLKYSICKLNSGKKWSDYLETGFETFVVSILSSGLFPENYFYSALISSGGAVLLEMCYDYFRNTLKDEFQEPIKDYNYLKSSFIRYISDKMESEGNFFIGLDLVREFNLADKKVF